jgi:hypothetical protein
VRVCKTRRRNAILALDSEGGEGVEGETGRSGIVPAGSLNDPVSPPSKLYIVPPDVNALAKRYTRDFPEQGSK